METHSQTNYDETFFAHKLDEIVKSLNVEATDKRIATELDAKDALGHLRENFHIPKKDMFNYSPSDSECIYFCGNSLGLQPKSTKTYIEEELLEWQTKAVEGKFKFFFYIVYMKFIRSFQTWQQ
jgi:kynureninase